VDACEIAAERLARGAESRPRADAWYVNEWRGRLAFNACHPAKAEENDQPDPPLSHIRQVSRRGEPSTRTKSDEPCDEPSRRNQGSHEPSRRNQDSHVHHVLLRGTRAHPTVGLDSRDAVHHSSTLYPVMVMTRRRRRRRQLRKRAYSPARADDVAVCSPRANHKVGGSGLQGISVEARQRPRRVARYVEIVVRDTKGGRCQGPSNGERGRRDGARLVVAVIRRKVGRLNAVRGARIDGA
jgi:hypothetical protein